MSWRKILWRSMGGLLLLGAVLYGCDAAVLHFRANQFGSVQVHRFYALNDKFGIDYSLAPPIDQRCVNALFPHMGVQPCWYVERHQMSFIKVG